LVRVGLVGPWDPHDVVDLLLIGLLREAVARDLDAKLVLVVGRGREDLPWPVPVASVDRLLPTGLDGLIVSGELATSPAVAGFTPPDVWATAVGLAAAAGIPLAWFGIRLVGDPPLPSGLAALIADSAPLLLDGQSASQLEPHGRVVEHPFASLRASGDAGPRSGRLVHAAPSVLAAVAGPDQDGLDAARFGTWVPLRPGRGDRLVGLADAVPTLRWDQPSDVLTLFARAEEVVTDDPAVAAIAASQGARPMRPPTAQADGEASAPAELDATTGWSHCLARLRTEPRPDAGSLRLALQAGLGSTSGDSGHGRPLEAAKEPAQLSRGGQVTREDLDQARQAARDARARAERWRSDYYRLRGRRSVRLALRLSGTWARLRAAGPRGVALAVGRRLAPLREGRPPEDSSRQAAPSQDAVQRVIASVESSDRTDGPLVSVLVLTRDGASHLRRLLPALEATRYRSFEVVVVDNGSGAETRELLARWRPPFDVQVLRNDHNATFGAGNNQAATAASGAYLLLLNDDIEPIEPGWLGHLVTTAERTGAGATGARLVYPPDTAAENVGDSAATALALQHRGIHFENWGDGLPRARNLGARGDATSPEAREVQEVPAATAACLLLARAVFEEVGGFSDGYDYGLEDVDLCLKLRAAGHRIVVDGATALWHHEFATQNRRGAEDKQHRRAHNRRQLADLWGPRLHRQVLRDRVLGAGEWSESPLHVAITVTRLDERRRFGDWYSAHELGDAIEALGWRVTYVERYEDRWYELPRDVDVLVVLIDAFDLWRAPDHLVTVAWVRNWTDRWVGRPWFDDYDIVLASSEASVDLILRRSSHEPVLFPLATNGGRFRPDQASPDERCDVVFVGSYWGEERSVSQVLAALGEEFDVRLYGRGWDQVPDVAHLHRGVCAYSRLPRVLASAQIVLDDTASPTKPYEAVNTRVFDALASGALPVSDNPSGVARLFRSPLPTWDHPDHAVALIRDLLRDEARRRELVDAGRTEVLTEHTYARRGRRFREALLAWVEAPRLNVLTGVPNRRTEHRWGDTHFARALQRQLRRAGVTSRLVRLPEWESLGAATADAVVHLFGLSTFTPRAAQTTLLWNISHPELVSPEQCERYDHVLVASERFAAEIAAEVSVPVHVMHQATDPDRFRPTPSGPPHDLLFVGNSRNVRRRVLDDVLPTDFDLAIYGWGWTGDLVDLAHVRSDHVPNRELGGYYAAAAIVLNDHWDDMRALAFPSNRLYDALAAGAFVISDHVEGLDELFDGGVVTYRDRQELHSLVVRYLADPWERERIAARGRAAVLARHSFAHRAAALLSVLSGQAQPATVLGESLRWPADRSADAPAG
jgi:GT2 family glycosyltransferase